MRKADELINEVSSLELAPVEIIRRLRKKVSAASGGLSAESVAKYLIKQGYLTEEKSAELLATINERRQETKTKWTGMGPSEGGKAAPAQTLDQPLSDDQAREIDAQAATPAENIEAGKYGSRRHKHLKKAKGNEFDSPLMLIGGCVLALLVLVGGGLAYLLNSESGDEILSSAESAFQTQSYSQAIAQYEQFVEGYSSHADWSKAKVMLAVARLRQAIETNRDYEYGLEVALEEAPRIEDEPEFNLAQADLASLLPKIAMGLAEAAESESLGDTPEAADPLVEKTEQALTLVGNTKYVPTSLRYDEDLAVIREILSRIERRASSRKELDQALQAMREATAAADPSEAYRVHAELLMNRQELRENQQLREALTSAAEAERESIEFVPGGEEAAQEERPSGVLTTVAVATQVQQGDTGLGGTYCTVHGGVAYGVDAGTGILRWRRSVGVGGRKIDPVYVGDGILLIDHRHDDLIRVDSETGALVWRTHLDAMANQPVLHAESTLVATESGRLLVIDTATGATQGRVEFAQPLRAAPCVSQDGRRIYLVGEHSSIYTLSGQSYTCLGVLYSGHDPGAVQAPIELIAEKAVVLENIGMETCQMRVFSLDDERSLATEVGSDRVDGVCDAPAVSYGRRLLVASDTGETKLFEFSVDEGTEPFVVLASRPAGRQSRGPRYLAANDSGIWIADQGIGRFIPSVADNRLAPQRIENPYADDRFTGKLETRESTLFHTRRPSNRSGLYVAATDTESGRVVWETRVADSSLGTPYVSQEMGGVVVANRKGQWRLLGREAIRDKVSNETTGADPASEYGLFLRLGGEAMLFGNEGSEEYLLASSRGDNALRSRLAGPLACQPTPYEANWLAPLELGQVHYLNQQGEPVGAPFQPSLTPGSKTVWLPIGVSVDNTHTFAAAATAAGDVYCLEISRGDSPSIDLRASMILEDLPVSRVAVIGGHAAMVLESGVVALIALPDAGEPILVHPDMKATWGPFPAGEKFVIADESGVVVAVSPEDAAVAWRCELSCGAPVGVPLITENSLTLVGSEGACVRIDLASGERLGEVDLGEFPTSGPTAYGERLLIYANDSTLLVTKRP